MKDENGNAITYEVLVEERYVGFTCDTCMSTFVISLNTFVNGHEVLDLYTVTYREVSKVIVDAYGNEETKIFAEYVMECVDYNADCIETNHDVIISSYELN